MEVGCGGGGRRVLDVNICQHGGELGSVAGVKVIQGGRELVRGAQWDSGGQGVKQRWKGSVAV